MFAEGLVWQPWLEGSFAFPSLLLSGLRGLSDADSTNTHAGGQCMLKPQQIDGRSLKTDMWAAPMDLLPDTLISRVGQWSRVQK